MNIKMPALTDHACLRFISVVQEGEDSYGGYMVQVMSGGSVEFTGEMAATGLENMRSVFWNDVDGSIE